MEQQLWGKQTDIAYKFFCSLYLYIIKRNKKGYMPEQLWRKQTIIAYKLIFSLYLYKNWKNGENTWNFSKVEKTKNLGSRECLGRRIQNFRNLVQLEISKNRGKLYNYMIISKLKTENFRKLAQCEVWKKPGELLVRCQSLLL